MKRSAFLACAAAAVALMGCSKDQGQGGSAAPESNVTITQASPPPGGTWADVVNETTDGFMMGNPNASVKLIEIGSLSCPHCKKFADEGVPNLVEKYVKTGKVSWEFRPYLIHGAVDMAADLVVRCNGAKAFFPLVEAMYKDQDAMMAKVQAAPQDELTRIQNLPTDQVFVEMAKVLGLQDWAAARGVPQDKTNACLRNQQMIDREVQTTANVNNQFPDFAGTPSFAINGVLQPREVSSWEKLQPKLDEALR